MAVIYQMAVVEGWPLREVPLYMQIRLCMNFPVYFVCESLVKRPGHSPSMSLPLDEPRGHNNRHLQHTQRWGEVCLPCPCFIPGSISPCSIPGSVSAPGIWTSHLSFSPTLMCTTLRKTDIAYITEASRASPLGTQHSLYQTQGLPYIINDIRG